jgi:uncharacterized protein YecE (DUF72 family)
VRIGCSGWQYAAWKGTFYPADLAASRWLAHYTSVFDTVEINNTFYRLPEAETFAAWRDRTPEDFLVAVKASRFLTHLKRLREPDAPLALLFDRARHLGRRLGPVLYQLPRTIGHDRARLQAFLDALPSAVRAVHGRRRTGQLPARPRTLALRHVVEFRNPSWYQEDVFRALAARGVALCLHDKAGSAIDRLPDATPFVYIRFHGTSGHYAGSYPRAALALWAARIGAWAARGLDVYAYFNNDPDAAAAENALTLLSLVREGAPPASRRQLAVRRPRVRRQQSPP